MAHITPHHWWKFTEGKVTSQSVMEQLLKLDGPDDVRNLMVRLAIGGEGGRGRGLAVRMLRKRASGSKDQGRKDCLGLTEQLALRAEIGHALESAALSRVGAMSLHSILYAHRQESRVYVAEVVSHNLSHGR